MRVLINGLSLTHGGGRSYILNLLREFARDSRGWDVTLLTPEGQLEPGEARGVHLETLRFPARPPVLRLALRVLYEQIVLPIRARRYDVLFCVADMTPMLAWTPTVVILRNLNIYDRRFYDNARLRALYHLTRIGLRRVARALFPTRAAAELIRRSVRIPEERLGVIPYGIAPDAFESTASIEHERPYVLIPAALERHKNLQVAIECLPDLADSELELWLVGPIDTDPGYVAELRSLTARLGLEHRVRFLGPVPYQTMLGYYRGASVFVFPSQIETFGHPILEAMLAGTPVVASDIPAFRELAGEAALYFPPDDPSALGLAIEQVLRDDVARERRRERGMQTAGGYTWAAYADALCQVFRDVLEPGARGRDVPNEGVPAASRDDRGQEGMR
jgi:glycosyltransferase involved in cell wall biosynthesis